jgi:uncharacterized protein (TIGR03067 family)
MNATGLEGTWQMIRAELSGEAAPDMVVQKTMVSLAAGAYEVHFAGEIVDRGSYAFDDTVAPPTLVLRGAAGPNAGRTIPCLFQLKGDRLRVCYGLNGALPSAMSTRAGQPQYLAVYRRAAGPPG